VASTGTTKAKINWREACGYYISLGYVRSYAAVARRYGVSDVAVRKHALAEEWDEIARPVDEKRERNLFATLRTRRLSH
jgi:hypothetical protein